jgi:hypothetical protein
MVPEEWPIAAPAADVKVVPSRPAGSERLNIVRRDFFLDPDQRLSEQERSLMTAMLHNLIGDVADELRAGLLASALIANGDDNSVVLAELRAAGLLDLPQLIDLLLRRADQEQVASAVRARSGRRDSRFIQGLISDEDAAISAAAMALILARGRRRDRFGQMRLEFDDLPADLAEMIVHRVSAALRGQLSVPPEMPSADRQLNGASAALLARRDTARNLEALTANLVRLLDESGRLDEETIAAASEEGEFTLVAEVLARRAAIGTSDAADMLLSGTGEQLMLLLRMAGMSREFAARLLAGPGDLLGMSDVGREIARFNALDPKDVDARRDWLTLHPAYRMSLDALRTGNGQRRR